MDPWYPGSKQLLYNYTSGINQLGYKIGKSTTTIKLTFQFSTARALVDDKCVLMSSLVLSSALNVVNIKLLLERLKIVGLPTDVIDSLMCCLRKD